MKYLGFFNEKRWSATWFWSLLSKVFLLENLRAYGTRARSARGSQNCTVLSIIFPFTGNSALQCVNDLVVDLHCRKDAIHVFFCEVKDGAY